MKQDYQDRILPAGSEFKESSNMYATALEGHSSANLRDKIAQIKPSTIGKRLLCSVSILTADIVGILISTLIATALLWQGQVSSSEAGSIVTISILFLVAAASKGHYSRRIPFWDQARELLKLFSFCCLAQGATISLLPGSDLGGHIMAVWVAAFPMVIITRAIARELLLNMNLWQIPTVIIGDGKNAKETALALVDERHLGYEIISFLSPSYTSHAYLEVGKKRIPMRHLEQKTGKVLRRLGKPHVVIALERGGIDKVQSQIERLILDYPSISVVPALRGLPLFGAKPSHFFSHEVMMLDINNNLSKLSSRVLKRTFDILVSSVLLFLLAPAFLYLAYLVRKTGRQIFFGHKRVGANGKEFKCYKFRSMVENSKEVLEQLLATSDEARREWYRDFKLKDDPRITKIGKFLRESSLDELPQLWNVFKGDMSLVGPRPVINDEIPYYGNYVNYYYKSRPGMTGLWQVSGRNDVDYESRVQLDVWYVSNWSLWNDIVIMIRTITVVLNRAGAY